MNSGKSSIYVNKVVKLLIGLFISVIGLIYAFRNFNWADFAASLNDVNFWYIFYSIVLIILSVWFRALRWKWLLEPIGNVSTKALFDATMVGYFGNSVLPFRMGEVLRAYVAANESTISTSKIIGTLIVERMLDLLAVIVLVIFLLFFSDLITVPNWIPIVVIFSLIILVFVVVLIRKLKFKIFKIENIKFLESKIGQKIVLFIKNIFSGLTVLNSASKKVGVIWSTFLLWIIYFVSFWLVIKGTGLEINIAKSGVLFVMLTLAITIPAAPGYIGTYHATGVAVLTNIYNIDLGASQTFVVISHAVGFVPFVLIGAVIFIKKSLTFSKLNGMENRD